MTSAEIEQRIAALEREVQELKASGIAEALLAMRAEGQPRFGVRDRRESWWCSRDAGRFADDPIFDEIVRLGREYRESQRPDPEVIEDDHP